MPTPLTRAMLKSQQIAQRKARKYLPYEERIKCPNQCGSRFNDGDGLRRHLQKSSAAALGCARGVQQREMNARRWAMISYDPWLHFVKAEGIAHEVAIPFRVVDRQRHLDGLGPDPTACYHWYVYVPGWVGGVARLRGIKRVTKEVWIKAMKADPKLLAAVDTLVRLENRGVEAAYVGEISLTEGWRVEVSPGLRTLMAEYLKANKEER